MKRYISILFLFFSFGLYAQSFGQNKVNARVQDWSEIKTLHFNIYFPKGEDDFGRAVALISEDIYYYLKDDLKYPILTKIPIVFYASKSDFQVTNIIYPLLTEGVGGFTESLRNRVVVPFDGSYCELEKLLAHELTHAYINGLDSRLMSPIEALRPSAFPFWFSEGLPEFLSIGGKDVYNNMFILDMVVNDRKLSLDYSQGYYAYRLGESFLAFIADTYGREKVSEYFYALRTMNNNEEATKRVFAMEFEKLESRWRYQIKRDFFPFINSHAVPSEALEQRTEHKKDGSYFNFAPRFSPDGSRYVYFSDAGARYSVWLGSSLGLDKPRKLITGEAKGKLEEFHYFKSNLSWFPDGKRVAFVAKNAAGDLIHILNVDQAKIERNIKIPQLSTIFELDISPDGKKIALSAQKNMQSDIFVYEIETGELTALTDDAYADMQPRWHPDGEKIVFASERQEQSREKRYGYFANLVAAIFELDIASGQMRQITYEDFDCSRPFYTDEGKKLVFLSERELVANLEIIDLETGQIAPLSKMICGVYSADISQDKAYLVVSNYFNEGWDIYFKHNPLQELEYKDYPAPALWEEERDFWARMDFEELDYYAPRKMQKIQKNLPANSPNPRRPVFSSFEPSFPDSTLIKQNYAWDERPESPAEEAVKISKYRPRFSLERIWGGAAYSSSGGMMGSVELGFSDLMGDYAWGMNLGISEKLDETNFLLSLLYLKRRADLGVGIYNFFDENYYRVLENGKFDYFRLKERQTGLYGLYRYPFSRFSRLEADAMLFDYRRSWDYLPNENIDNDQWINDIDKLRDLAFAPGVSYVYDNALWGSTGPLRGIRANYTIRKGFAKNELDYLTNYVDIRSYALFNKRYSFAMRANAAISSGKYPDRFSLGGYHGVRALSQNLSGERKLLGSFELRYPFLEHLSLAFPIPLILGNIRGSAYVDVGAVWNKEDDFRGIRNGVLEDIKLGYGFGPRLSLGYFVLKLDVAWLTDLSKISKPQIYLSLSDDF